MTDNSTLFDDDDPPEPTPEDVPAHQAPTRVFVLVWSRSRRAAKCRSCDAPITFVQVAASSKWMPFDADPVALRTSLDPATHNLIEHLDAADVHFRSCAKTKDLRR
jgi:hypothetical protein